MAADRRRPAAAIERLDGLGYRVGAALILDSITIGRDDAAARAAIEAAAEVCNAEEMIAGELVALAVLVFEPIERPPFDLPRPE